MSIQEAETQFYGIFPNAEHNVIKTGITLDVRDASDNKLPLEAYKIVKTYAAAESLVERKVDPSDNTVWYYDAYPGETISVVQDGSNNGLYVVMGTQDPSQNGLTLHRIMYSDDPSSAYTLQSKIVNPSTATVNITPDTGYYGLSSVTVSAIDSGLDPDLVPGNIKKDVEIFGVTGTYTGTGSDTGDLLTVETCTFFPPDPSTIFSVTSPTPYFINALDVYEEPIENYQTLNAWFKFIVYSDIPISYTIDNATTQGTAGINNIIIPLSIANAGDSIMKTIYITNGVHGQTIRFGFTNPNV